MKKLKIEKLDSNLNSLQFHGPVFVNGSTRCQYHLWGNVMQILSYHPMRVCPQLVHDLVTRKSRRFCLPWNSFLGSLSCLQKTKKIQPPFDVLYPEVGESVTSYIQRFHEEILSIPKATNAATILALIKVVRNPKLKWKLLEHDIST